MSGLHSGASQNISALSPVQVQVVAALASGQTVSAAAEAAGIHRTTIHNWQKSDATFQSAVREAHDEVMAAFHDGLRELSTLALNTIRQILTDSSVPAAVKLKAALAVLHPQLPPRTTQRELPVAKESAPVAAQPAKSIGEFQAMIARSAPCPCGSGLKFKRCCGAAAPPKLGAAA
jgi:uncharacterized protein YecA (UPF0149 family)